MNPRGPTNWCVGDSSQLSTLLAPYPCCTAWPLTRPTTFNFIITARIILHLISYPQFTYDLFHMHHSLTYLSREHMNPKLTCSQRQWLHSSVGRASHRYREVTGSSPVEVLNFFQVLLYAIVKIAIITARIILHLISYPQFTYDLFHMHHSLTYLSREHMNPKLTCSQRQWLHSSVGRASHRYREVTGSSPVEVLNFFQASLRNCKNCDHNCEDHSSFDFNFQLVTQQYEFIRLETNYPSGKNFNRGSYLPCFN